MLTLEIHHGVAANNHDARDADRQLLLDLQMFAPGAVTERPHQPAIAEQRFAVELTALVVAGVKLGVFSGMVDIVKTYLQNRPKAEITLRAKDGSELKITNTTPKQAIELFAKQNEAV